MSSSNKKKEKTTIFWSKLCRKIFLILNSVQLLIASGSLILALILDVNFIAQLITKEYSKHPFDIIFEKKILLSLHLLPIFFSYKSFIGIKYYFNKKQTNYTNHFKLHFCEFFIFNILAVYFLIKGCSTCQIIITSCSSFSSFYTFILILSKYEPIQLSSYDDVNVNVVVDDEENDDDDDADADVDDAFSLSSSV